MIQGIDGSVLLNALRAGKEDRWTDQQRALEMKTKTAALERQNQINATLQGLFAPSSGGTGGVAGMFSAPPASAAPPPAAPTTLESAFDAQFTPDKAAPPPAASTTPPPAMPAPQTGAPGLNGAAFGKLMMLDPELAGKIGDALKTVSDIDLKRTQDKNDKLGLAAHWLLKYPPDQRKGLLATVAPQLLAAGWTEAEIANADLSDNGLNGYQGMAIDFDKMIDNELADREFRAGKVTPIPAEGSAVRTAPTFDAQGNLTGMKSEYVVGGAPDAGGGTPAAGDGKPAGPLKPGDVKNGYRFKGGNPNVKENWEPAGGGAGNSVGGFP